MKMRERKLGVFPALLVAVLSFGGFVGAATIASHNGINLTPVSLANDGEDDGDSSSDNNQEDSNKDSEEQSKETEKKSQEAAKKQTEKQKETTKKAAEQVRKSFEGGDDNENEVETDTEDVNDDNGTDTEEEDNGNGDDNAMFKDQDKTVSKLQEEIAKAEKEILEKQAEGVDVTAALARLAQAKAGIASVNNAFTSNDLEKAKDLSQEVKKLAHFATEKDLHDAKEVVEKVAKVEKRIAQTYGKITLLEAVGGDGGTFKPSLASYEADLATLKATVSAGGYDAAAISTSLETLERKVKTVKSSIESAIYALGGTDSELDNDLENESEDVADNLNQVADIEDDNLGRAIRGIATDHKNATKQVGETVKSIDQRNPVVQTLFGASESDLNSLEQEIVDNQARVAVLTKAADTIQDADVKNILLNQVKVLNEQAMKLQTFVSGQRDRLSIFGWVFHLFGN